jgi:hypothetical protein
MVFRQVYASTPSAYAPIFILFGPVFLFIRQSYASSRGKVMS